MMDTETERRGASMTHTCDLAIVGGGIGGLTLAASLAHQSISVQVFEQDNQLREIGAGIAIGGNATRLLHRLGLDLSPVANVPPALELRRWERRPAPVVPSHRRVVPERGGCGTPDASSRDTSAVPRRRRAVGLHPAELSAGLPVR